ncbi:hypothetical protein AAZX31_08G055400 [Glycine max]
MLDEEWYPCLSNNFMMGVRRGQRSHYHTIHYCPMPICPFMYLFVFVGLYRTDITYKHKSSLSLAPIMEIMNLTFLMIQISNANIPFHSIYAIFKTRFRSNLFGYKFCHGLNLTRFLTKILCS